MLDIAVRLEKYSIVGLDIGGDLVIFSAGDLGDVILGQRNSYLVGNILSNSTSAAFETPAPCIFFFRVTSVGSVPQTAKRDEDRCTANRESRSEIINESMNPVYIRQRQIPYLKY